jgi:N-acetylglucosaminyl-diphospho-decaprenol L-rhamnosyltransferase
MEKAQVDIVIPVYNAPEATEACIRSVYRHLNGLFGKIFIHEDKSPDEAVRGVLKRLSTEYLSLDVVYSPVNLGFAGAVNAGVARSSAPYVLVLNSDVVAKNDCISRVVSTLNRDPVIAAVNVAGERFYRVDFSSYIQTDGFVESNNLSGYAFLIRWVAFDQAGGFDISYGRGYYEDNELSRTLIRLGWKIGIQIDTSIDHKHQGSFSSVKCVSALIQNNRKKYYSRHPDAAKKVLVIGGKETYADISAENIGMLDRVVSGGGRVFWMTNKHFLLPNTGFKFVKKSTFRIFKLLHARKGSDRKITNVVVLPSCSWFKKWLVGWMS